MSNALKNAVESGRNVVESGAHTISDLVDEARSRIEDLPPLSHARRRQARKNWTSVFALVLLAVLAAMIAKRRSHQSTDQPTDHHVGRQT
ncbi:MAG: hypothetical protein ABI862_00790 [Ilumatobacteraceae bacterium]